jgi:hypothetical protein
MLLSSSELFWVGLVQGALSAPPLAPPEDPEYYERHDDSEPSPCLYNVVAEYGELCGLGKAMVTHAGVEQECMLDLADIRWSRNGKIVNALDIAEGSGALIESAAALRDAIFEGDPLCKVARRFDELLEEFSPVAFGYSPKTPDVLYGMKNSGRIVVIARVPPMPRGIVRVVLRLLAPHLDTPAAAFMALAASGDAVPDWHEKWIPSSWSMESPLKNVDRRAAIDAIEREIIGAGREEPAYILGRHIGYAEHLLRQSSDWLAYELMNLHDKSLHTQVLEFIPATTDDSPQSTTGDRGEETEATGEAECDDDACADAPDEFEADVESSGGEWWAEVRRVFKAACAQVGMGAVDLPPAHAGLLRHVTEAMQSLKAGKSLAIKLGIDTMIPAFDDCISRASALVGETSRAPGVSQGVWLIQQQKHRQALVEYPAVLRGAVPLAFGELRLKELLLDGDMQGLEPSSMEGWAKLADNARSAVRDGLSLLKNGFPPYVVINAVQPTLEAIVRALAAKHLVEFRGVDLGKMLYALLQRAKEKQDEELEAVASAGLALRLPRNNAVHDPERVYDKHDAAFFLNGLAIMLRSL